MHSVLAPSSASVWGPCAGSVLMELQFPGDTTSEAALEGTLAHDVALKILSDRNGTPTGTDYTQFPPEIYEGANLYANDVTDAMRAARVFGGVNMGVEVKIDCTPIHPECFGTPDAWLYDDRTKTLHVWDFKFGRGLVEVFRNKQLTVYIAGLLALVGEVKQIIATIVQPRASHTDGPIRRWKTTPLQIRPDIDALSAAAHVALGDAPLCVPGGHCRNCRGRHACEAANYEACLASEMAFKPTPRELSLDALGLELMLLERAAKALKSRQTGLMSQAESLIRAGSNVPGYAMVPKRTHRQWAVPEDDLVALGIPGRPVTPNQAELAGIDKEIVAAFTEKPRGAMTLKREDGSRARHIFGQKEAK